MRLNRRSNGDGLCFFLFRDVGIVTISPVGRILPVFAKKLVRHVPVARRICLDFSSFLAGAPRTPGHSEFSQPVRGAPRRSKRATRIAAPPFTRQPTGVRRESGGLSQIETMKTKLRSTRLLDLLEPVRHPMMVTHDNPDPDAIASGWALCWMVQQKLDKTARLIGGGGVVRAENRHMLKLLEPPLELIDRIQTPEDSGAILVDCSADTENHLLASSSLQPLGVIDHHQQLGQRKRMAFRDIRPNVAASATICASYLQEQGLRPPPDLATALLYAINTETQGSQTYHSRLDRRMVAWLAKDADPTKLAEIKNAPLTREYFSDLGLALQATFVYDGAAFCILPKAEGAEIIGEVADLLVRCECIRSVLCAAVVDDALLLSVRTDRDAGNAALLVRRTLTGIGSGGGHEHRAGGKILLPKSELKLEELSDELRNRWLTACGVERQRGTRLVRKREIVRNL
jgi:nanoRNase/pAp phosphatase (c-di-AMP/oligoRNAs hydrolase)